MELFCCYYTYVIIDPRNSQPFYVGKGKGRRMYSHWSERNYNKGNWRLKHILRQIDAEGLRPVYSIPLKNVTEIEAWKKEIELVQHFGRIDLEEGSLCNMTGGGEGVTPTTLMKLVRSQYEKSKNKGKPVSQYTMDGFFIASYPSAKRASETVEGANRSYITQCCKKRRKSAGGFLWIYEGEPPPVYTHEYHRSVCKYSPTGKLLMTYKCLTDAANEVGVDVRTISHACAGMTKSSAGYIWRYADDPNKPTPQKIHLANRKVQQLTLDDVPIQTFSTIRDAAKCIGVSDTRIRHICIKKYGAKTAGGYKWEWVN